jgi:hypothetical protein
LFIYNDVILTGKIHESLEDPISQTFYDISGHISPTLYSMGITPNIVTTTRLIMTIYGFVYLFANRYYRISALFFVLSYFGDCLDGHMARKYNMDTEFGDYYDHFTDYLMLIISFYYISVKIDPSFDWLIIVIFILGVLSLVQIGCEERYLKVMGIGKDSTNLSCTTSLCPESIFDDDELEDILEFSRLWGFGGFALFITIIIWNFKYFENKTIY